MDRKIKLFCGQRREPETATVDFLSGLQDPEIWAAHGDMLSVRFDPRHRRV